MPGTATVFAENAGIRRRDVGFWPIADIRWRERDVRFQG
jgi:hypothetical protein